MANLLVGATGFIGGHLAEYLYRQNEISKATFRKGSFLKIMDSFGVQCVEADVLDPGSLHEAVEGVDTIYNLASRRPEAANVDEPDRVNADGLRNLLAVAQEMHVKTFVHLSTMDVYGFSNPRTVTLASEPMPAHPYQESKLAADILLDELARHSDIRVVIIRAARAIGARDPTMVTPLLKMIKRGSVVVPAGGTMSFTHPQDIAQAMYEAATNAPSHDRLYLVKSFDAAFEKFAESTMKAAGRSAVIKKPGLFVGKTLLPRYSASQIKGSLVVENQDNWRQLGYSPLFDVEKTADDVAAWWRKEPWLTEQE